MIWRLALALAIAIGCGGVVFLAWSSLRAQENQHAAQLLELESYATRSDLVKALNGQFRALELLAAYWEDYGHLLPMQWNEDARLELSHFQGIETILWSDPSRGVRYATWDGHQFDLQRRPTDEQWAALEPLLQNVSRSGGARVLGPTRRDDAYVYRVQVPALGPGSDGVLVAAINASEQLDGLLSDRSPGHAITVYWGDREIYRRGEGARDLPEGWVREGYIELSTGPLWRVVHAPGPELADSLARPTIPGLLAAGWIISAMLGGLVYLVARIRERALAAERAEQRFAELNADLENKVHQRTEELQERTADLETISQSVSHDIRNPMNTVSLTARLIERRAPGDDDLQQAVGRIDTAMDQMNEVVRRLNTYSRVAFVSFNREPVDMGATVAGILDQFSDAGGGPPDVAVTQLPACRAQPVLVEILWHNLISNALKYSTSCETPRVTVGAEPGTRPTVYFVRDTGVGFDPAHAEAIFKPFARLDGNGGVKGQGLGLAIVARVVGRHDGRVWAESAPGEGATFRFHLGSESVLEDGEYPAPAAEGAERAVLEERS